MKQLVVAPIRRLIIKQSEHYLKQGNQVLKQLLEIEALISIVARQMARMAK
jgi:hypothetical protein